MNFLVTDTMIYSKCFRTFIFYHCPLQSHNGVYGDVYSLLHVKLFCVLMLWSITHEDRYESCALWFLICVIFCIIDWICLELCMPFIYNVIFQVVIDGYFQVCCVTNICFLVFIWSILEILWDSLGIDTCIYGINIL